MLSVLFSCTFLLSLFCFVSGITISFGSCNFTRNSPAWLGPGNWSIEGPLVISDPFEACTMLKGNSSIWKGAIVLTNDQGCSLEQKQRAIQDSGGLVLGFLSLTQLRCQFFRSFSFRSYW
jgi:hypothetical protein